MLGARWCLLRSTEATQASYKLRTWVLARHSAEATHGMTLTGAVQKPHLQCYMGEQCYGTKLMVQCYMGDGTKLMVQCYMVMALN